MDSSAPLAVEDHSGFTLIEILVVVGIISTMALAAFFSLGRLQITADTQTSVDKVLATIQSQRMAAMLGAGIGEREATAQGIYFDEGTNKYISFSCETVDVCQYLPSGEQNIEYFMEPSMTFSLITFPDNQIVFVPYSGELFNHVGGQNTVEIKGAAGDTTQVIEVSSVGTPTLLP